MTSYQRLKQKKEDLKKELSKAKEFERMMKNLFKAIERNDEKSIKEYKIWFLKNSIRYNNEI